MHNRDKSGTKYKAVHFAPPAGKVKQHRQTESPQMRTPATYKRPGTKTDS